MAAGASPIGFGAWTLAPLWKLTRRLGREDAVRRETQTCEEFQVAEAPSSKILFLGNSHLSAIKLAYDEQPKDVSLRARFFCARAADLFFTRLSEGKLIPFESGRMSRYQLACYFGRTQPMHHFTKPLVDVGWQFEKSGGAREIDLQDVATIFYVCGTSPYDFVRLGEDTISVAPSERRRRLSAMLGRDFYLSRQIEAVRRRFPACKHILVGRPLGIHADFDYSRFRRESVEAARMDVQCMAGDFLFDHVVMPPEELLSPSLLSTKSEFFSGGRQESEVYQGAKPTTSDTAHVNKLYGSVLLRTSIIPIMRSLTPANSN